MNLIVISGLIVVFLIASLLLYKKKKTKIVSVKTQEGKEEVQANPIAPTYDGISVYAESDVLNDKTILPIALSFLKKYVYARKAFESVSLELIFTNNQYGILAYTSTNELCTIVFNEEDRVVGFQKKGYEGLFDERLENKENIFISLDSPKLKVCS